jgi:hypothetical protein
VFLDRDGVVGYAERRPDDYGRIARELIDALPHIFDHADQGARVS